MTIERVTLNDPEAQSADPVADNIAALKALFPAAVADGQIDFDTLRQLLGDDVDDGDERYGLNWPGKRRARRLALTPSTGTLRPAREDSVDWDTTRNLMIEGDNLEVLKLLQKSYAGKAKLIYIDPPYNTGNDFVYPDDYADNIANYLTRTGQVDNSGLRNTSNSESSGRFHTDWLNMIYPRIELAKTMLSDDGVMLVSIDDGESANLREVCDEIFGESNFVANIIWQKKYAVSSDAKGVPALHDNILLYSKSAKFTPNMLPRSDKQDSIYRNLDDDPRGLWRPDNLLRAEYRPRDCYEIVAPVSAIRHVPPKGSSWRHPQEQMEALIADNRVWFGRAGESKPALKRFLNEVRQGVVASAWWPHVEVGHNDESKKELRKLFDGEDPFDTPKPVRLIERMLQIATSPDSLVVDFFAGSGTTAHGVMARNAADGGTRRYILVQLPEPLAPSNKDQASAAQICDQLGKPRTIAELTKERLRRAASKVRTDHPDTQTDLGFRTYKLSSSNLRAWEPSDDLAADLLAAADNIVQGRTEDDLLTELLLKQGIDLTEPMVTETIAGAAVHAMGAGVLVVCLAPVTAAGAEALADGIADWIERLNPVSAATIFFKDAGFENDVAKANVAAILEQRLDDKLLKVRSL